MPDLCDSGYCENGGSCNRTGLDAYDCTCAGSWSGTTCTGMCDSVKCVNKCTCLKNYVTNINCTLDCSLSCMNGRSLNRITCSCDCTDNFNGNMCEGKHK